MRGSTMAIIIKNEADSRDTFVVKCRNCGRELSYNRADLKIHRNYPNGFIYCPVCKAPNAHNENNIFEKGEEIEKKEFENYETESLIKRIRSLKNQFTLFVTIGILSIAVGGILLGFFIQLICSDPRYESLWGLLFIPSFMIPCGIPLVILAFVLEKRIKKYNYILGKITQK